jgi:hypothetical protein
MSREQDRKAAARRRADSAKEPADTGRFIRGLTVGLIVGAVIAGSTLWRRFGPLRTRS